jgi:hypothetical protein
MAVVADAGAPVGTPDELPPGADPLACPACVELGDACGFHQGFAEGWDACAEFMAGHVGGEVAEAVVWLSPGADVDVDELDRLDEAGGWVR